MMRIKIIDSNSYGSGDIESQINSFIKDNESIIKVKNVKLILTKGHHLIHRTAVIKYKFTSNIEELNKPTES